jgi:hypothetical protein
LVGEAVRRRNAAPCGVWRHESILDCAVQATNAQIALERKSQVL